MALYSIAKITTTGVVDEYSFAHLVTASSANITATLPSNIADGSAFLFRRTDATAYTVTIVPHDVSITIDGSASLTLSQGYMCLLVYYSPDSTWYAFTRQSDAFSSEYMRFNTGTALISLGVTFVGLFGVSTTESTTQLLITRDCVVRKITVALSGAPGLGSSRTFTVRKGLPGASASDTALTCTISGASALTGSATTNVVFSAGDLISIQTSTTGISILSASASVTLDVL